uniref:Uncharacterized protein n=1 Tax=Arion vulgaris TaxID=1028688 RepID=A0A0B6ZER3_9EUPU
MKVMTDSFLILISLCQTPGVGFFNVKWSRHFYCILNICGFGLSYMKFFPEITRIDAGATEFMLCEMLLISDMPFQWKVIKPCEIFLTDDMAFLRRVTELEPCEIL